MSDMSDSANCLKYKRNKTACGGYSACAVYKCVTWHILLIVIVYDLYIVRRGLWAELVHVALFSLY
jgi:hypothetical protein